MFINLNFFSFLTQGSTLKKKSLHCVPSTTKINLKKKKKTAHELQSTKCNIYVVNFNLHNLNVTFQKACCVI